MTRPATTPPLSPPGTLRRLMAVAATLAMALTIVWFSGGADNVASVEQAPDSQISPQLAASGKPAG